MATVQLPISLRTLFADVPKRTTLDAATVAEVIDRLDERWPGMRNRLCDHGPVLREFINVFVDGQRADLSTPVGRDSLVHILPAMAGGSMGSIGAGAKGIRLPMSDVPSSGRLQLGEEGPWPPR